MFKLLSRWRREPSPPHAPRAGFLPLPPSVCLRGSASPWLPRRPRRKRTPHFSPLLPLPLTGPGGWRPPALARSRLRSRPAGCRLCGPGAILRRSCSRVSSATRHSRAHVPGPWTVGRGALSVPGPPGPSMRPPCVALVSCALHPRHERGRLLMGSHLAAGSRALGALAGSWVAAGLAHLCGPSSQVAVNT